MDSFLSGFFLLCLAVTVSEILSRKKKKTTKKNLADKNATFVTLQILAKLLDTSDFRMVSAIYFIKVCSASLQN